MFNASHTPTNLASNLRGVSTYKATEQHRTPRPLDAPKIEKKGLCGRYLHSSLVGWIKILSNMHACAFGSKF